MTWFPSMGSMQKNRKCFHTGEVLRNMNGNDYRVLAALSPENLLLMAQKDSQIIVGRGVQFYGRYPKDERPDSGSMVTGIEWDHGVYLGNDITKIDFDILKQEYGEPDRVESVYGLRENKYRDVCFPVTKEFREKLNNAVLETYQQAKEQAVQEGQERASQQMQTDERGFMKCSGEPLPFR